MNQALRYMIHQYDQDILCYSNMQFILTITHLHAMLKADQTRNLDTKLQYQGLLDHIINKRV